MGGRKQDGGRKEEERRKERRKMKEGSKEGRCTKAVSRDIPVQNIQPAGNFQYNIFSQEEYFSTKFSVSRNISVLNIQSVEILQYKKRVSRNISVQNVVPEKNLSVQHVQSIRIFQYKIFSQWEYFSSKKSVSRIILFCTETFLLTAFV